MAGFKDYYEILGVPKTATQKEIRSAFRKLAAKHHPDRNPDDTAAEERFKEINEAYTVLNDPEKRKIYDQYGTEGGRPFPPQGGGGGGVYTQVDPDTVAGFSDFFQSLFGGSVRFSTGGADPFADFGTRAGPSRPRSASVEAELELDLPTAYRGGRQAISVDGRRIEVTIPAGVRHGARLRLRGQAPGGGDLLLRISLAEHSVFALDGDHVRVVVKVPAWRAVLGGPVRVPTLDGEVEMTLPPGTQAGRTLRLRGQGWPRRDGSRGDELAEVRIVIPTEPSAKELELYRQLAALAGEKAGATKKVPVDKA